MKRPFTLLLLLLALTAGAQSLADELRREIGSDNIGVAVITSWGDTVEVNGERHYPLMSVFKFHQAVALARKLGYPGILATEVEVSPDELREDTWSPMRRHNPYGGHADISALLHYSLQWSDNNACDILFDRFASPAEVDSIIRAATPARDFAIACNEAQMHADTSLCRRNWSTPLACAELVHHVFTADTTVAASVVKAVMAQKSPMGRTRLAAAIPQSNGMIFHKTGTGDMRGDTVPALNDAGHIVYPLPEGGYGRYSIAVFVADYAGTPAEAGQRIEEISRIVWKPTYCANTSSLQHRPRLRRQRARSTSRGYLLPKHSEQLLLRLPKWLAKKSIKPSNATTLHIKASVLGLADIVVLP